MFKRDNHLPNEPARNSVERLLLMLNRHYAPCARFVSNEKQGNLARSASRFIQVEGSMINTLSVSFSDWLSDEGNNSPLHSAQSNNTLLLCPNTPEVRSYYDLYQRNIDLIRHLKRTVRQLNNPHLSAFFSYWVAALQIENDELAKLL